MTGAAPPPPNGVASRSTGHLGSTLDRVAAALERASRRGRTLVATVEAPVAPVERLLETFASEPATLWRPPTGPRLACVGTAHELRASGPDRFGAIRRQAAEVWSRADVLADDRAPTPRWFGGFAFQEGGADASPWRAFGDALFVLPSLRYAVDEQGRAFLTLAAGDGELGSIEARRSMLRRVEQALASLASGASARPPGSDRRVLREETIGLADWTDAVEAIRSAIDGGPMEKVVAARRALLTLDRPVSPLDVARRLAEDAPRCTVFAFRRGDVTFLGATPERLVARRGSVVETEALAGSIASGDAAERLLASSKDLAEHAYVVHEIVRCLTQLCRSVRYPDAPDVRALRHVLHLSTPIRAVLADDAHVVDLVSRLHPTPAVGGVPTRAAVRWIAEHEATPRGWYAGPVGWFDPAGDGEFCVALRSGVLVGAQAHLFAGSGIVRDSEPEAEYAETNLKLRSLRTALRVET